MSTSRREIERFQEFDKRLVSAAKNIKLLSTLSWPAHLYDEFVQQWQRKNPKLPKVPYPKFEMKPYAEELRKIARESSADHPIAHYIQQTAMSYYLAALMLENLGKPVFREFSEAIYGGARENLGKATNLEFAEDFIAITSDFSESIDQSENQACLLPEVVAAELRLAAEKMFGPGRVGVIVDPQLSSKAAAGAERVRVRAATSFSHAEIAQLIQHELYVHSATALNGREQPYFKCLGLGSPRSTCTQEGMATFAELITATMDLTRLRRIALRIKAIDVACQGGDFLDVFKFFMDAGQPLKESFQSSARIFRGADIKGTNVFTKDVVYLKGLFSVHTFLRKAIEQRKIDYPEYLFVGRLAVGDVMSLEPMIEEGWIARPRYRPQWITNREGLAAYLAYAAFANKLRLKNIKLEDFTTRLDTKLLEPKNLSALA